MVVCGIGMVGTFASDEISTAGTYFLSTTKLRGENIKIYIIIGVVVVILALGITYVVIKKKYWFW